MHVAPLIPLSYDSTLVHLLTILTALTFILIHGGIIYDGVSGTPAYGGERVNIAGQPGHIRPVTIAKGVIHQQYSVEGLSAALFATVGALAIAGAASTASPRTARRGTVALASLVGLLLSLVLLSIYFEHKIPGHGTYT
uniref:Uncharacterized protein n=1 Tax=Sexangularia sp. CB-2014 TaxID=1486929 RepID=A0A7S1VAR6_9EUKA